MIHAETEPETESVTEPSDLIPTQKITLQIDGGVSVVVPDSLDVLTTYVVKEQGDWFEDEIRFVRRALSPGDRAIDIGANFGLYALSMAQAVGSTGKVWAFEPATSTASFLADSIAANHFTQLELSSCALSDREGTAVLSLHADSEMNQLVDAESSPQNTESVAVTTLDAAMEHYQWHDISFLKIDAEGQEQSIINGGARFFDHLSPLVQYEAKSEAVFDLSLVHSFMERAYAPYRLVPGLNVLVPFDPSEKADKFLFNLFCCKPDRAKRLSAQGHLILPEQLKTAPEAPLNADSKYFWQKSLARLPYGKQLASKWKKQSGSATRADIENALAHYARSRDAGLPMPDRFGALRCGFDMLQAICATNPAGLRYASLARVALDYGAREIAVESLQKLYAQLVETQLPDFSEPFLAVSPRYDPLDPKYAIDKWLICSVLEAFERAGWLSSYYTGKSALPRLTTIKNLEFCSAEMTRRLDLIQQRFAGA